MIKAVIFDCFGVLATDDWQPFKEQKFGGDPELFKWAGELNQKASAGLISYQQFVYEMATKAGVSEADMENVLRATHPNEELFGYIRELKSRYKIGLLSNSAKDWMGDIFSAEQRSLLDAIVLSFRESAAKPDHKIYQLAADRLGVKPSECIFVDDQARYVRAARAAGMEAVEYKDFERFKSEFAEIIKSA